ncbi:sensor histidine kinase [Taibaiella koreensis]|uniref:sensor histidine kinase n=1 Tax=Taibaiella koreensis TaxID=1268548 RepID=UPI0013C2CD68|nr:histidine kinase [Taibaiella koreensis]
MPFKLFFLSLLYLLSVVAPVYAQRYSYTNYDIKDGLAGSTVNGMTQDKSGFIWFSTETGLSRFDGTKFKNFRREDGLPSNETFAVYADTKSRIWIIPYKNTICYYWNGKIYNDQNDTTLRKLRFTYEVNGIAEDAAGNLLVETQREAFVIYAGRHTVKFYAKVPEKYEIGGLDFKPVAGVGGRFPATMISARMGQNFNYLAHPDNRNFSKSSAAVFFSYLDSSLAILYNSTAPAYYLKLPREARVKIVDDSIVAIMNTPGNGARFFNIYRKQFTAQFLRGYTIHDVFRDIEGNIWFSTKESGVFKLSPAVFRSFFFTTNPIPVAVLSIFKCGKELLVGTNKAQCWKLYPTEGLNFSRINLKDNERSPLLKSSWEEPLFINYASSDYLHFAKRRATDIKTLMFFHDTVLISNCDGVFLSNLRDGTLLKCLHKGRATCAYRHEGLYYIGTLNGLYTTTNEGEEVYLGNSNSLFRNRISSFAADKEGTLWIATYENGIVGYRNGSVTVNITQTNGGLNSNICRCLYRSGNTLWVGTEKGLNKVDMTGIEKYKVTGRFSMADGLTSDIVNAIYVNGPEVYVGTANGLVRFNETKVPQHSICYLRMTDIRVSEKSYDPEAPSFELPHADNNISFEFVGISFLSEGNIRYQYRLRGMNDQWKVTSVPILTYPSLPSGKYTLEIIAVNKFNDKSELMVREFEIRKSLPEEIWFRVLILVLITGIIWLLVLARFSMAKKKEAERSRVQQQLLELEHMALRAQMNPHFIFNCLNSIQHHIMQQDTMGANIYLSQFADLVRQTLNNAPRTHIMLSEEIAYLTSYMELEKLQIGDELSYSITVDPALNRSKIKVPNMVIQPYVENAIKHGIGRLAAGGTILVQFRLQRSTNVLECIIEDNGPGMAQTLAMDRESKRLHASKGLSITQNRIQTLNQLSGSQNKINVRLEEVSPDAINKGTRVILHFPL